MAILSLLSGQQEYSTGFARDGNTGLKDDGLPLVGWHEDKV